MSGQVNAVKQRAAVSISTARPVNTAAPKPKVNDRPKGNVIDHISKDSGSYTPKRFDYVVHKADSRIFYSGCSRHITGNKFYLLDYQDIDGGFVAFAGSPKGGKITGKVLLKIPRQNNMYSFDLKNVVPSSGLTCLFAKATIDESNLWHRRLGHINFKTMNKLMRGNLVRVFVRSINKKTYCLVVTDDFSRFSWVFFLATKDETPKILKNFITGIENQIDHKVKTIRCDNGTEFKNRIINEFCEMKGIRREFSIARTPQQNGVAKRKNRTLIEAARTMLVIHNKIFQKSN
ncbi:putative ribonuclease H-like domain-containing protein [Tanacetum coccineum]